MTWSIVARDAQTGPFGVAVATRAFAVGASCPFDLNEIEAGWIARGLDLRLRRLSR